MNTSLKTAIFGGGCFWCTEAIFTSLKGVSSVMPGYCQGVEVARLEYDPAIISFGDLLSVFFYTHDPTTLNRQGNDIGTQYRSVIFYSDQDQKSEAENLIKELNSSHAYDKPVVTTVKPAGIFHPAEDYHVRYYESHKDAPYCQLIIEPKLEKLQAKFARLLNAPKD